MLDVGPPLPMHSTLTSNQPLDFLLPLARQHYEPPPYRSHQERQEYGDDSSRSVKLQDQGAWTAPDGLRTPPEDMTGANLNPLGYGSRVHGNGYFPKPYSSSNSTSFGGFPGTSYSGTCQAVDKVLSRPQSPSSRKDLSAPPEQSQRRKSPSGSNSIVSYLQIPSSINNSKGSLAEFAAQV